MSGFSPEWLSLREAHDAAARATRLTEALERRWSDRPVTITDLGSGTGANLRYLAPTLGGRQVWTLVDNDQALLDALPERLRTWAVDREATITTDQREIVIDGRDFRCRARTVRCDLADDSRAIELPSSGLVTASALLDLVSADWLEALARRCSIAGAPVLFALTYDGRMEFDPEEPEDERVRELVNAHQMTDKGFGPALGPAAAGEARRCYEDLGYAVDCEPSDWRVGADATSLQEALLEGWFGAAVEIAPGDEEPLARWLERRRAHVAEGQSALMVGHVDLLGWPPDQALPASRVFG